MGAGAEALADAVAGAATEGAAGAGSSSSSGSTEADAAADADTEAETDTDADTEAVGATELEAGALGAASPMVAGVRPQAPRTTARRRRRIGRTLVCRRLARWSFALALLALGCTGPRANKPPSLTRAELEAGPRLSAAELRARARPPTTDVRQTLKISLLEGVSGRGFEGRGALVVRPGQALRMILLGPGGTTAMDVWISGDRFRAAIPALDRVVRGDASTPRSTLRGLPIDLLRRWLVAPFGGTLVHAREAVVDAAGHVGPGPGLLAFALFGRDFVIRARVGDVERGWFFSQGALHGRVEGRVTTLADGARFPSEVVFEGDDPPLRVVVVGETTELAKELPAATFADPDAS